MGVDTNERAFAPEADLVETLRPGDLRDRFAAYALALAEAAPHTIKTRVTDERGSDGGAKLAVHTLDVGVAFLEAEGGPLALAGRLLDAPVHVAGGLVAIRAEAHRIWRVIREHMPPARLDDTLIGGTAMDSFPALDVAVGLSFIYFLLSVLATTATETISRFLKQRARMLESWLENVLGKSGGDDQTIVDQFFDTPAMQVLQISTGSRTKQARMSKKLRQRAARAVLHPLDALRRGRARRRA